MAPRRTAPQDRTRMGFAWLVASRDDSRIRETRVRNSPSNPFRSRSRRIDRRRIRGCLAREVLPANIGARLTVSTLAHARRLIAKSPYVHLRRSASFPTRATTGNCVQRRTEVLQTAKPALAANFFHPVVRALLPSIGYAGSLNPGVEGWPLVTSRSTSASSSAVKR